MKIEAEADRLAALVVMDRNLELIPEPFRMQPDVEVIVDFGEYLKFVQSLPTGHPFLYFKVEEIQQAIEVHNELALLKSFYTDMALAVCKELSFAENNGTGATVIRHNFYDVKEQKNIKFTDETGNVLRLISEERGFPIPPRISSVNIPHWAYACKLLQDVRNSPTKWVEKI